jgi:hypothetical protein
MTAEQRMTPKRDRRWLTRTLIASAALTVGEGRCGEPLEGTVSGNLVALVSRSCTAYSGRLGFTAHELYERQADGSLRYRFDMFGMR